MVISEDLYQRYIASLLAGDKPACRSVVSGLLDGDVDLKDLYTGLIQRSMYDVGERWEHHKVSVAVEHLATAITEQLLTLVYPRLFARPRVGKSVIISCAVNEFHQLGGKMVADVFELHGWDGYFLGANTPLGGLFDTIEKRLPTVVGLSVSLYANLPAAAHALAELERLFPSLPLMVGGQAFRWGGDVLADQFLSVCCIRSLDELERRIQQWQAPERQASP